MADSGYCFLPGLVVCTQYFFPFVVLPAALVALADLMKMSIASKVPYSFSSIHTSSISVAATAVTSFNLVAMNRFGT
jgi:hypothetical protein